MDWIRDNAASIGAIAFAAYALARAIVAATPTPKDDEALKKISVILKVIAGVFGLDLKQGRQKKEDKK